MTVHDENTLEIVRDTPFGRMIARSRAYRDFLEFEGRMFRIGGSMMSYVFYSGHYLRQHLDSMFEVKTVSPEAFRGAQTAVVLGKRTRSSQPRHSNG